MCSFGVRAKACELLMRFNSKMLITWDNMGVSTETHVENEIRSYDNIKVSVEETHLIFNILEWWHSHRDILPMLSRFARFIHYIPASSAASFQISKS